MTPESMLAEKMMAIAHETPWECRASDVILLSQTLADLDGKYVELQDRYDELLRKSISHSEAMAENMVKMAVIASEQRPA